MTRKCYRPYVALTLLCLATLAHQPQSHAQSPQASATHAPLPRDAEFTATGTVKAPQAPTASHHFLSLQQQALALSAAQSGVGRYGLPVLPAKDYDATAIKGTLNDLMAKWHPAQGEYAGYFTWMPWKIDVVQEAKSLGALTHPNTVFHIDYYNVTPDVGIAVESMNAPFIGAGFTATLEDTIFVVLDGFSSPVPVAVARNVQHDFASGFVTRLVLDAYVSAAQLPGHDNYAGLKSLSLSLNGKFKANSAAFAQFSAPSTYQGQGVTSLDTAIALSTATQPITSQGLLLGWKAADELLSADQASGNHQLQKDVWSLLSYRYTFEQLGTMTGFTLNYLSGEAMNDRILSLLTANPKPQLIPSATYAHDLLQNAAGTDTIRAGKQFVVSFGNVMEAEFYAVSQNGHLKKPQKQLLLARYYNLMEGYREGLTKAANVIYQEITGQVYNLAYADGFRDGYESGYAAGWKDGYAQGNANAWQQANVIIGNLQSQISNLQNQLNNANSGGGGFWNDVGGVLNDVGTAIGIIGSFF
jgi:hypothetical protein